MLIAEKKRKENMAEYLLYMWQVEDLIRANGCDIENIERNLISHFNVDDGKRAEIRDWYENLVKMMEHENVKQSGHLQITKNIIIRLTDLHNALLASPKFPEYRAEYYKTLPFIVELRAKSGEEPAGEIETCFNLLYGTLMLRLQHREVSKGTEDAVTQVSRLLARLSALYLKDEQKPIFDDDNEVAL